MISVLHPWCIFIITISTAWKRNWWYLISLSLSPVSTSFPQPCLCFPQIKQTQDEEKKQLTALRDLIKSSLQLDQKEVGRSHLDTQCQIQTQPLKVLTRPGQTDPCTAKAQQWQTRITCTSQVALRYIFRFLPPFAHPPTRASTRFWSLSPAAQSECPVLYHAGSQCVVGFAGDQCCASLAAQWRTTHCLT